MRENIEVTGELEPFEIFISELLDNLDVKINLSQKTKSVINFFSDQYNFIDSDKDINIISYCFGCEYFSTK